MGVSGDGRDAACGPDFMSSFERRHVQLSFKRSAVLMTAAAFVSGFHVSPLWMVAAYGVLFAAGLEAGRHVHGGSARMFDRGLARAVAWEEVRPGLTFLTVSHCCRSRCRRWRYSHTGRRNSAIRTCRWRRVWRCCRRRFGLLCSGTTARS